VTKTLISGTENLLLIKFDELRVSPDDTLSCILKFLGVDVDPKVVLNVVLNNSLEQMRAKEKAISPESIKTGPLRPQWCNRGMARKLNREAVDVNSATSWSRTLEHLGYPSGVTVSRPPLAVTCW
jgi:hypothetical protein